MRARSAKWNGSTGSSEGNSMIPTHLDLCRAFHRLLEGAGHVELEGRGPTCDGAVALTENMLPLRLRAE